MCPILIGAERRDVTLVKLCLSSPLVELGIANNEGKTALILAVENSNVDMLNLLLREEFMDRVKAEHQDVS